MTMSIQATPPPGPDRLQSGQRTPQARSGGWLRLFQSIWPVTRAGAARDALAGFQLAAMNIPQALGYTKIAGMPVVTGFYTLLLPLLACRQSRCNPALAGCSSPPVGILPRHRGPLPRE